MRVDYKKACLIISCMQKEFIPSLVEGQKLVDSCCWLIDFCNHLNIPVIIVNHKNLGTPLKSFLKLSSHIKTIETTYFSCLHDEEIEKLIQSDGRSQFILAGAESHISILQSAFSFQEKNIENFVVCDAISSRNRIDHDMAINRLNQWNVPVITKEMMFFESLGSSLYPNYIDLSLKFLDQRYLRD